jgi:hypothetical protein
MNPKENLTPGQAIADLKKINHEIDYNSASKMINEFRSFYAALKPETKETIPSAPNFLTFNKKAIEEIISKPGCVGLRVYPAIKEVDKKKTFSVVLVGVDEKGNNIIKKEVSAGLAAKTSSDTSAFAASATNKDGNSGGGSGAYDEVQTCPPYPKPEDDF